MRPCSRMEEWLTQPVGRYFIGDHHLIWCDRNDRAGTVIWGRLDEAESERLVAAWDFARQLQAPYVSVVDFSAVTGIDANAYTNVARFMSDRLPVLARRIRRQALIRPAGVTGAVVAGFYPTLTPGFEWRDFTDAKTAYAWSCPDTPELPARLAELTALVRDGTPLMARLRHYLRQCSDQAKLEDAARALGCAERTLQRELAERGSSFREERTRARIEHAASLLIETDLKVEIIGRQVGYNSVTSFVRHFREILGELPGAYRQRLRRP